MGKIILIGATKGGVGKRVSSYNLAYSLAKLGKKVQAAVPATIGHLMMDQMDEEEMTDASEYIMSRNGVDFIPSSMVLSAVDAKLEASKWEQRRCFPIFWNRSGIYMTMW